MRSPMLNRLYKGNHAMKYNVLQVISDQHQAACMGCEEHRQAITPHMDRLAREGMRFSTAYAQNPICTPSRVSILSGQYCHNHGFYALEGPNPTHLQSFLGHFRAHGYRTAAVGKLHLPNVPSDWIRDHVDLFGEYLAQYRFNAYHQWARAEGFFDEIDWGRIPELPGFQQHEARASRLSFEQSVEGFTVAEATRFIQGCGQQPWAAQVSLFRPHQCYTPAKRFWDMYDGDLEPPIGLLDDASHRPPHFRRMVEEYRTGQGQFEPRDFESWARRVWRGYLASITHCDHALGVLIEFLEKIGQLDRTIIIYHSDHGAYSGTYGVPEKAPGICSEAVCRVPMIWRVPGITPAGRVCNQLVENVDLAPTLTELCELPPMPSVDGVSLTPLLKGKDQPVKNLAVTENMWSKAIRWDRWRFVHYQPEMFDGEDVGELYDLSKDPHERVNLYHDPGHRPVVEQSRRLLLEWLIRTQRVTTIMPDKAANASAPPIPSLRYSVPPDLEPWKQNYL